LDEPIAQQGKGQIVDASLLHGHFWPEDERIEDFLTALYEWRGHKIKQIRYCAGAGLLLIRTLSRSSSRTIPSPKLYDSNLRGNTLALAEIRWACQN